MAMSGYETMNNEREEIELLLPWYETGRLSAEDMRRVETYLAGDTELRNRLELVREESAEVIFANERVGMPSHEARERLMARIAAEGSGARRMSAAPGGWLKRFAIGGFSPGVALGGALAAIVIIVQAAVLVSLMSGEPGNGGPSLASGEETAIETGTFALIRFQNAANAEQIAGLLSENGAVIVDGPGPGGVFRVRISSEALSDDDRDARLVTLRERPDLVAFIAPSR